MSVPLNFESAMVWYYILFLNAEILHFVYLEKKQKNKNFNFHLQIFPDSSSL